MSGRSYPGKTYCGSWVPTEYEEATGWVTRLVCVREPHDTGRHRSRTGHTWNPDSGSVDNGSAATEPPETPI